MLVKVNLDRKKTKQNKKKLNEQNLEYSTESLLNKINSLLTNFVSFKKINKHKLKFQWKPWITTGFQKSISVKDKFVTNFIKKMNPTKKNITLFAIQKP